MKIAVLFRGTKTETINLDDFDISEIEVMNDGTANVTAYFFDEDIPVPLTFKGITKIKYEDIDIEKGRD